MTELRDHSQPCEHGFGPSRENAESGHEMWLDDERMLYCPGGRQVAIDLCPGNDPTCPGHDHGDPCHYRDLPGSPALNLGDTE